MKNHRTIWAALALGTVLGVAGASLLPHAAAVPTAPPLQESVTARLDALAHQVTQLQVQVQQLELRASQSPETPSFGTPPMQHSPGIKRYRGPSNIPPYEVIPASTTAR